MPRLAVTGWRVQPHSCELWPTCGHRVSAASSPGLGVRVGRGGAHLGCRNLHVGAACHLPPLPRKICKFLVTRYVNEITDRDYYALICDRHIWAMHHVCIGDWCYWFWDVKGVWSSMGGVIKYVTSTGTTMVWLPRVLLHGGLRSHLHVLEHHHRLAGVVPAVCHVALLFCNILQGKTNDFPYYRRFRSQNVLWSPHNVRWF